MLLSQNAPLAEQAKLTETLGAEYLLVGTISNAKIEIIEKPLKAANYTTREYKARMTFDYRIVDSITKKIVLASVIQKYLENDQVRALADEIDPAEWDPAQVRDAFLTIVANDVITEIIANVYPIKIVDIQQDGTIILDQGGDRIKNGMLLDILSPGKELFDTDTGESLGGIENHVATAQIIQTGLRTSRAKIITGDRSKISKGHVCRLQKTKKPPESGTKPDIKRTKSGGVKLPFDK
jgi:nucleoside diphosphate kinase